MQKIFGRRVWRNFRENLFRYLSLAMLILLGIYLVISIVGAAETVIVGVRTKAKQNHVEDGQFSVFIPLTEAQLRGVAELGLELEEHFFLDFTQEDGNTLRVYPTRQVIDLIDLKEGRTATADDEVVLERRYCEEHKLSVGNVIILGGGEFKIVGIGVVPDYDSMLEKLSDSSVDSSRFGLAFVSRKQYESFQAAAAGSKSEEYIYAYRRLGKVTDQEIKEKLQDIKISDKEIHDTYFLEYWKEQTKQKSELEEGIQGLVKATDELTAGLRQLRNQNSEINAGTKALFTTYLSEVQSTLASYGIPVGLTEENYKQTLTAIVGQAADEAIKHQLTKAIGILQSLEEYKKGIISYTGAVSRIAEGSIGVAEGMQELDDSTDRILDTYFNTELSNLTMFLTAEDNPRIGASLDDQSINKLTGLVAGVIVMLLLTYVISVFVIHEIEQESSVIGALYSLGMKKRDLMLHYLMLPVMITFLAASAGSLLGFSKWGVKALMKNSYDYFSIPDLQILHPAYLVIYGLVMPIAVTILVNLLVIHKRLSLPALKLMRKEQRSSNISRLDLGRLGFVSRFRIRQMLRELRTGITVIAAMFISLLIMMIGMDCYALCKHISEENKRDTRFEYMYTYKYPEQQVPVGGEAAFLKTFKKEIYSYNIDISLLGIDNNNPYFEAEVQAGKNKVVISSSMAQKFHLTVGDVLVLSDEEEDMDYAFQIIDITQYSVGMYAFMELESMRELFGEEESYYNVVFSNHALNIAPGRLYAETTKQDISISADVFIKQMLLLIIMMLGASIMIFSVVLFLMMRVMIDRSSYSISLVKIFGYNNREIRKLYLNGNFYIIAFGAAISIPLSKLVMDSMYPLLISNVACGMNLAFSWQLYARIYGMILILYFVINQLLVGKLKRMIPAEILKNRE